VRGTFAYIDPSEKLIILIFAQCYGELVPGQEFINAVYEALTQSN